MVYVFVPCVHITFWFGIWDSAACGERKAPQKATKRRPANLTDTFALCSPIMSELLRQFVNSQSSSDDMSDDGESDDGSDAGDFSNDRCGGCEQRLGVRVGIYIYTKRDVKGAEIVLCTSAQRQCGKTILVQIIIFLRRCLRRLRSRADARGFLGQ